MDPEAVLLKSGLDAGTAAAFLHENMLEFVDNEGMEETAQAYSYLSHSGMQTHCLHAHLQIMQVQTMPCMHPGCASSSNLHVMGEVDVDASDVYALAEGHLKCKHFAHAMHEAVKLDEPWRQQI